MAIQHSHFNQMWNATPDQGELAEHLREMLAKPESRGAAADRINEHAGLAQTYRENSIDAEPRYKPAMFFLSYFWHLQAPTEYPVYYVTTEHYLEDHDRFVQDGEWGEDYVEFIDTLDELINLATETTGADWEYRDISNAIYWDQEPRLEWEAEEEGQGPGEPSGVHEEVLGDFLPPVVSDLSAVAQRDSTAEAEYEEQDRDLAVVFEEKLHHSFRILGFDVEELGQGSGRQPDGIATAVRNDYAIIYDAKVRGDGYSISTDDRAIREYIERHARQLRDQGVRRIYFAIVSSTFTDPDRSTLRELRETTAVESIVFLSAELLEELMVLRLREPYLNLDDIRAVFGTRDGIFHREELNNVLPDWRDVTVDEFL
ncbi:hypothetical protein C463_10070 [Halorubrum californiense DSM 19288]|uniref:FokI cleavage domain-containing protein n=1 Tax=Halorubrum californiense DSM 19288 TaxID=1227465 RepID=M0E7P8_9EURY|nr:MULTISPECIES: restriction endonuclease FokI C-terminal domain-containing protein [Halorubrum]ELZ42942.1 hypothetical protein C463_10070 [Halorubrum californiense DSM 19288]TKX68824.1 hypothetical protein EXE40_11975 [Halorubrum sp. GN11GM_10-3_MGM]